MTEKIDGTSAQVCIGENGKFLVGSRTRWITPEDDNYGFARWAYDHRLELLQLGPGRHFGEWWGQGIQRNYGLKEKRFSLFNTGRWHVAGEAPRLVSSPWAPEPKYTTEAPACCGVVPILLQGPFSSQLVQDCLDDLRELGSSAAPGFMNPEGIVVYHVAAGVGFKKTIEKDEEPKGRSK